MLLVQRTSHHTHTHNRREKEKKHATSSSDNCNNYKRKGNDGAFIEKNRKGWRLTEEDGEETKLGGKVFHRNNINNRRRFNGCHFVIRDE